MSRATGRIAMVMGITLQKELLKKGTFASKPQVDRLKRLEAKRLKKFGKGFNSAYKYEYNVR